jgi:hypothetical protein
MVHVRMGYEEHVHRFQNPLGQMMNLAAIDKDAASQRTDVEQKNGIVEKTGEKGRLDAAKREAKTVKVHWFRLGKP